MQIGYVDFTLLYNKIIFDESVSMMFSKKYYHLSFFCKDRLDLAGAYLNRFSFDFFAK